MTAREEPLMQACGGSSELQFSKTVVGQNPIQRLIDPTSCPIGAVTFLAGCCNRGGECRDPSREHGLRFRIPSGCDGGVLSPRLRRASDVAVLETTDEGQRYDAAQSPQQFSCCPSTALQRGFGSSSTGLTKAG